MSMSQQGPGEYVGDRTIWVATAVLGSWKEVLEEKGSESAELHGSTAPVHGQEPPGPERIPNYRVLFVAHWSTTYAYLVLEALR